MIFLDYTRTGSSSHRSGLTRVTQRLRDAWGDQACPVHFSEGGWWQEARRITFTDADWLFTGELFNRAERPGLVEALDRRSFRSAALFHDAIPLKRPDITWPKSVSRHPDYMKLLARFDRVFAVSSASRDELEGYWRWLGLRTPPTVEAIELGSDLPGVERVTTLGGPRVEPPLFLSVGIIEPRKNQLFLLEVAESLWAAGRRFSLHLVGRVNPHFGRPTVDRIRALQRAGRDLHHHQGLPDTELRSLYARACIHLFPTQAEGCGLPLLEALWQGTPCFCSDLPVLRENAEGGGCLPLPLRDPEAWRRAWDRALQDPAWVEQWRREATTRTLPRWADTAAHLQRRLTGA